MDIAYLIVAATCWLAAVGLAAGLERLQTRQVGS